MKKIILLCAFAAGVFLAACSGKKDNGADSDAKNDYQVLAYVWSGGKTLPDPNLVDAINYSFGRVNEARNGVNIENEEHLREVVALKEQNPDLKVMLALGGGCSEGFTDLAACDSCRKAFAADLKRIVDTFGLDGIDYDWETPGFPDGTPEDVDNFIELLRETREAIGDDKIISVASMAGFMGMKMPDILDYVDYFNAMNYDMTWTRLGSHTSLRESEVGGFDYNVERSMTTYKEMGVPPEKIMLGLAFYGRGDGKNFPEWTDYRDIKLASGMEERWDSIGCVPYIVDSLGQFVLGYDNPRSLEIKCDLIKELGLRGAMIWRTELDNDSCDLLHTVVREMRGE